MANDSGMHYAPKGKPAPVVKAGQFKIAAVALDHDHIYGMCNGLTEAGAEIKWVYDPDPAKMNEFLEKFPQAACADSLEQVLADEEIQLVAAAAIPSERCPLGIKVMNAGKDYFTDKTPLVSLEQLEMAKVTAKRTGKKYMVYYGERLHVESAVFAGQLVKQGAIGRVIQVIGMGPHRLNADKRPEWFFKKENYGGILCDIGSHQIEQFLFYTGATDAEVLSSKVANYNNPKYPELEDFGDCTLVGNNGATHYFRVDWFTPDGLSSWGDGRIFLLGTEGTIELRKYVNVATSKEENHVFLVNDDGEQYFQVSGKVGYPFFGDLILDCMNRTENAMTQEHAFKAAELCVKAQMKAVKVG
ncbi:MAG: Gfo/Idh/MocA family protein [Lachnospiraceae bacterium]